MRTNAGLTLLEVIVAIGVLVIGVFAAVQFQMTSIRATGDSEVMQQLTRIAQAEIEWRRQTAIDLGSHECQTFRPEGYVSCEVTMTPCVMLPGQNTFTCNPSVLSPIAYQVRVEVEGPRDLTFGLESYYTGIYVAGATGSQGDAWSYPPDDPEDDTGAPVTPGGG